MHPFYADYYWKDGRPAGSGRLDEAQAAGCPQAYKIVVDPYRRRHSVERYCAGAFAGCLYDSLLLNFKNLRQELHPAWRRSAVADGGGALLRDPDDRVLYREEYRFVEGLCRECRLYSCHGLHLSTHRLYYRRLGDAIDGVVLFDAADKAVFLKEYNLDDSTGLFDTLLREEWRLYDGDGQAVMPPRAGWPAAKQEGVRPS